METSVKLVGVVIRVDNDETVVLRVQGQDDLQPGCHMMLNDPGWPVGTRVIISIDVAVPEAVSNLKM